MAGEDTLFFGGSYGTSKQHFLSYYKGKDNYLKAKYPVTE